MKSLLLDRLDAVAFPPGRVVWKRDGVADAIGTAIRRLAS